jgi:hypothetical protein
MPHICGRYTNKDFAVEENGDDGVFYLIPRSKTAKRITAIRHKRGEVLGFPKEIQAMQAIPWLVEHVDG